MMNQQFDDNYYGEEDENLLHPDEADGGDFHDDDLNFDESQYFNNNEVEEDQEADYDEEDEHIDKTAASNVVKKMKNELYELDYEDIVAGMPCRFKYTQVEPEDFGLSIDEILLAGDSELNKFVSLKHISAYSTHRADQKDYSKRRKRLRAELRARAALAEEDGKQEGKVSKPSKRPEQQHTVLAGVENKCDGDVRDDGKKKRRRRRKDGEKNSIIDEAAKQVEKEAPAVVEDDQTQAVKSSKKLQPPPQHSKQQQRGWKQRGGRDQNKKNAVAEKPPSRLALYK